MSQDNSGISRRGFIRGAAVGAAALAAGSLLEQQQADALPAKALSYNPDMEYRPCGKTGWKVSAVCLGGHWKRVHTVIGGEEMGGWYGNIDRPEFQQNRREVVQRCIDRGINYIDACSVFEVRAYSRALQGLREKVYLGTSWDTKEPRVPEFRTADKLLESLDWGLKDAGLEYSDLWRITCLMDGKPGPDGKWIYPHTEAESEQIATALIKAKKAGKIRAGGISSHDRNWLDHMIKTYPEAIEVVVTPYTAKTKALPQESLFDTIRQAQCGFFGIKPFSSNAVFKGDSSPTSPTKDEDSRIARLSLRYILCNPAITAPIPGLISPEQVDNAALAVAERRQLDLQEKAELDQAMEHAWARLPADYEWLKNWEHV